MTAQNRPCQCRRSPGPTLTCSAIFRLVLMLQAQLRLIILFLILNLLITSLLNKNIDGAQLQLRCASPHELVSIINLNNDIQQKIDSLRLKLCSYQIARLRDEEARIKKRVAILRDRGLYDNYGAINRLTSDLKKVQSRITTLEIRESMGDDIKIEDEILKLEQGVDISYEVFYFEV